MTKETKNEVSEEVKNTSLAATQNEEPMGFEDEDDGDLIVPRVKIIQSLSPERKDKIADEGDIINSLTKDKYNGKVFIPVFKFNNIILWRDRADGGGIAAFSNDNKVMVPSDGTATYPVGRLADFDNSKQGKDAIPTHVRYMNFFGFFEDENVPVILSFSKTNYAEGKKLYSLAKVSMQNMWHQGYILNNKEMSKAGNDWHNIAVSPAGQTTDEQREHGLALFHAFRNKEDLKFDMDEESNGGSAPASNAGPSKEDVDNAEF